MALVNAPADALCLELSVAPTTSASGGRIQLFDVTPGSSPLLTLGGLPSGSATLSARSFGVACAQVQASTTPTWVASGPVPVTLVAGQPVSTSVVLVRPGSLQVSATFNDGTPTIAPTTKDFGGVQIGGVVPASFAVTNPGTAAITLPTPTINGTDSAQFQVLQNGCSTSLAAGATCSITVVFKPTTGGNKTASLVVGSLSASLIGSALVNSLVISPSPATFPSTSVGSTASLTITLSNNASVAISLGSWSMSGSTEFTFGTATCGSSLPALASCTQVMTFAPQSAGTKTATLVSSAGASVTLNGTAVSSTSYRINCGGSAVSPFTADQYASGGTTHSVSNTITLTGVTNPAPQAVYQSERYGTSTYTFPSLTPSSRYSVRLHFAELYWTASGKRVFTVAINGSTVLSSFDIYAAAGATYKAVVREFTATADAAGQVVVKLTTVTDNASISGIEIIPACTPSCTGKCGGADGCGGTCPTCTCPTGTKNCNGTCIPTSACCSSSECTGGKTCNASYQCVCSSTTPRDCGGTCIASAGCCTNADCANGNTCDPTSHTCGCTPTLYYRDLDGDSYGDPNTSQSACSQPSGWVSRTGDCDDSNPSVHYGAAVCNGAQRRTCTVDGAPSTTQCADGCYNGTCRSDGTIGLSGYVSCGTDHKRCTTAQGCFNDPQNPGPGICAGSGYYEMRCDGPNDCNAGQVCCVRTQYIESHYLCYDGGACPPDADRSYYFQVCDPLQPVCPTGKQCDASKSPPICVEACVPSCTGVCGGSDGCGGTCPNTCVAPQTCTAYYQDADGDGYGTPNVTKSLCAAQPGWVTRTGDCDDSNPNLHYGVSVCSGATRRTCSAAGGVVDTACADGCFNGACRSDGTVGLPGFVTCGTDNKRCTTAQGCFNDPQAPGPGLCGGSGLYEVRCDGPNDCSSSQVCCKRSQYIESHYLCFDGASCPPDVDRTYYNLVCDPLQPVCPTGMACAAAQTPHICVPAT
jgi:hypothetical protein